MSRGCPRPPPSACWGPGESSPRSPRTRRPMRGSRPASSTRPPKSTPPSPPCAKSRAETRLARGETERLGEEGAGRSKGLGCKAREEPFPRRGESHAAGKATKRNAADEAFSPSCLSGGGDAEILPGRWLPPRHITRIQLLDPEPGGLEDRQRIAVQVASAGDPAPHRRDPLLPAPDGGVRRASVLGEQEPPVGGQRPPRLPKRAHGIVDGAQRIGHDQRVHGGIGERQPRLVGGPHEEANGEGHLAGAARGHPVEFWRRIDPPHELDLVGVVERQVPPRADPQLEHLAAGSRHDPLALLGDGSKAAAPVDEPWQYQLVVQPHGASGDAAASLRARKARTPARQSSVLRACAFTCAPRSMPSANVSSSRSYRSRLVRAMEVRERVARSTVNASESSANVWRENTACTRPCSIASRAPTRWPDATSANARFSPTARTSIVMTMAGTKPMWISG